MTKISNQVVYIPDTEINGLDYLIGTDYDNAKKTVNFRVEDLGSHFNMVNGVRNFDYIFYQHQGVNPTPTDGYFYSNGNTQIPENIEYFIFPKKTYRGKDSSQFFLSIATENPFDLIIAQKIDNNTVFFFRIDSIETFTNYFKLNVSEVFFPNGKALDYVLSYAVFNLKNEAVGPMPTKTSDLTNDGEDGINPFITAQDLPSVPTKTSQLENDGSDGTSTYVETDELGATAFSNNYNDLDNIPTPISNHSELNLDDGTNPHGTTKDDVGLGNVDNTSDIDKPISTATQQALDLKLDKVTSSGVERVYTINADGSQGSKATSELGNTQNYFTFSTNTTLSDAHHNAVIWVTATCNITIPAGLRSDFNATFRTFTGAIATFVASGITINAQSDGSIQSAKSMSYVAQFSTNNYIISGGGLS